MEDGNRMDNQDGQLDGQLRSIQKRKDKEHSLMKPNCTANV